MNIDLTGRVALVTASTAGIGHAIARGLADSGAEVVLHGRSAATVDRALQSLRAALPGARLRGAVADLSDAAGADALLAAVPAVDILVNNAGIYGPQDFFETDDATWERYWQTNVMSGVRLSRALLPAMVDKGWGRVVFIASESARNIPADMIHYGVSKTAQLALSRGLAKRVAGSGVTVNAVLPGPRCPTAWPRCSRTRWPAPASRWKRSSTASCAASAPARSSSARPRWTRWPRWWSTSARRRPRPPPARPCGWMAAWWTTLSEAVATGPARLDRRTAVALLVAAVYFMENLDATVITTALPAMARDFGEAAAHLSVGSRPTWWP
jgi:NAD(P)-dependent dehydrogenase (short-subunit alcohol dehydrogenase family)